MWKVKEFSFFLYNFEELHDQFLFGKIILGCHVDPEQEEMVESRGRVSNEKATAVVQVVMRAVVDTGVPCPDLLAPGWSPPAPAVTVDADGSQLPLSPENYPPLTAATSPRKLRCPHRVDTRDWLLLIRGVRREDEERKRSGMFSKSGLSLRGGGCYSFTEIVLGSG